MKKVKCKTTTYEYEDGIMIDIVEKTDSFEAWLYDENYGIKGFMWESPIDNMLYGKPYTVTFDNFKELVERNIEDYIIIYHKMINYLERR